MAIQWELWVDGTIHTGAQPTHTKEAEFFQQANWVVLLPTAGNKKEAASAPPVVFFRHQNNPVLSANDNLLTIALKHAAGQQWATLPASVNVLTDGLMMASTPLDRHYSAQEHKLILTGLLEERYAFRAESPAICHTPIQQGHTTYSALPHQQILDWQTQLGLQVGTVPINIIAEGLLLLYRLQQFDPGDFDTLVVMQQHSILWIKRTNKHGSGGWQHHNHSILPTIETIDNLSDCLSDMAVEPGKSLRVLSFHPRFTTQDIGRVLQDTHPNAECRPWVTPYTKTVADARAYELRQWIQTLKQTTHNKSTALPAYTLYNQAHQSSALFLRLMSTRSYLIWGIILFLVCTFSWVLESRIHQLQNQLNNAAAQKSTTECLVARQRNKALHQGAQLLLPYTHTTSNPPLLSFTLTAPQASNNSGAAPLQATLLPNTVQGTTCLQLRNTLNNDANNNFTIGQKPAPPPYCQLTLSANK